MTPFADLAVRAFLQGRHDAARRLFGVSSVGEDGDAVEPDEPTAAYAHLVQLLRRTLDDETNGHPQPFDVVLEDLVALESDITDLDGTARGRFVKERIRRVGFELSRLTNRPATMKRFGPRATVGEALWHVASASVPAANTDDDPTRDKPMDADGITTGSDANDFSTRSSATTDGHDGITEASTTAPDWRVPEGYVPSAALPAAQFTFSGQAPRADVRLSSADRYRRSQATLHRAGRVQGPRTTILVRLPADETTNEHQGWANLSAVTRASVRFELGGPAAEPPANLAFHQAGLAPTEDGFTLSLDMEHAGFATDGRPEEVWSAILGADDVNLWVSMNAMHP